MKAVYRNLLDKSIAAALSAIEIYNKPDFKYREEVFTILIINAWELLFKARVINTIKKVNSLYVYDGKRIKRTRSGAPMTKEILGCIKELTINEMVRENIKKLIEIRDTAIHFYNSQSISYLTYTLGAATLRNYSSLINKWFKLDLGKYNFYILPLGFAYNFQTFSTLDIKKEPKIIQNMILDIANRQVKKRTEKKGYFLICEIEAKVVSAKKMTDKKALKVRITQNDKKATLAIIKKQRPIDLYPLSYTELLQQLKKNIPALKVNHLNKFIKKYKIKQENKYSTYNFRTKKQEQEYKGKKKLPMNITSIYNTNCLKFIKENIKKEFNYK